MEMVLFYYKDDALIKSLYAQIFSGYLKQVTTTEGSRESSSLHAEGKGNAEASVPMLKGTVGVLGESATSAETSAQKCDVIEPHDAAVLDVLEKLKPFMKKDVASAHRGDVVNISGKLYFLPKEFEAPCIEAILPLIKNQASAEWRDKTKQEREILIKLVRDLFKTSSSNCRFVFTPTNGKSLSGFLKLPNFFEDSLSLFLKYGATPIPCQMVALMEKHENQSPTEDAIPNNIFEVIKTFAAAGAQMWSNGMPDSIPVTPIAFFMPVEAASTE